VDALAADEKDLAVAMNDDPDAHARLLHGGECNSASAVIEDGPISSAV